MKPYVAAGLLIVALATPAVAAGQHYAVVDTVGNCSVINTKPSPFNISGLKILGDKIGYSSPATAEKVLKSGNWECKGMIERA
jgi:hypothetical protein